MGPHEQAGLTSSTKQLGGYGTLASTLVVIADISCVQRGRGEGDVATRGYPRRAVACRCHLPTDALVGSRLSRRRQASQIEKCLSPDKAPTARSNTLRVEIDATLWSVYDSWQTSSLLIQNV